MRYAKQSFEIIEQCDGYEAMLRHIERCARVSYKSEDRITDTSAAPFVQRLIDHGHLAALEHGTLYLALPPGLDISVTNSPWLFRHVIRTKHAINVTTNYRTAREAFGNIDLKPYICPYKRETFIRRVSVRLVTNRAVANEFVRHRTFSFMQESTRWVNYAKGIHGGQLTFIVPDVGEKAQQVWQDAMFVAEKAYNGLIRECGLRPEEARGVLPLDTKTELIMTGAMPDWEAFFKLRCAPDAHPQARELARALQHCLWGEM